MPYDGGYGYEIPAKYKHDLKVMECRVCGKPMRVGIRTRKAPRCQECGIEAMARNNIEMHEHRGEAYEKCRRAMAKFIEDTPPATPPGDDGPPLGSKE